MKKILYTIGHSTRELEELVGILRTKGLTELLTLVRSKTTAIMCAEAVPWRCHRSMIGDALLIRDWQVLDIFDAKKSQLEKLTPFAKVSKHVITYPAEAE